jgi:hypothetical protein
MARVRDYRSEYARRIARGLAAGKTRSQARGHGAEKKGAVGASKDLTPRDLPAYLRKLKQGRSVKVMATLESGRVVEIARGKPGPLEKAWTEDDAEGGGYEWDRGYRGDDKVVRVQVIYS